MADVVLPPLPTRGQSPWFDERDAFDTAVRAQLEGPLSESRLNATVASKTEVVLTAFGATGDGVTNDTAAVVAWINAVSSGRSGYAPRGTYMVDPDVVVKLLSGAKFRGDGDRRTIFKARSAGARLLDFRQSGTSKFEDIGLDGNNLAECLLDIGNTTVGASTGNKFTDVRVLNQLDRGLDLSNNGDTVLTRVNGGPWPDTATGVYWPNAGGNNLMVDPKLFPVGGGVGSGRASVEASFQNMQIRGGALIGLKVIGDPASSQTLEVSGVQFYPIKDGPNVWFPPVDNGLYSFIANGATKFAVNTPTQSYFDGKIQYLLAAHGSTFNSGSTTGTPNAFGPGFQGSHATVKLALKVEGSVLRAEAGATTAAWNDTISANIEHDYRNFGSGGTQRNTVDRVRAGTGSTGTGLTVGQGVLIRQILSSVLTPTAWATDQVIAAGQNISTATAMGSIAQANGLIVECSAFLPAGVTAHAKVAAAGSVRLEVHNMSGASYTLPGGTGFRVYALQI